ncbi:hypothetical protein [Oscillatoria acuminata]|uniref:Uncharacterized protein n=1 Tax=Oscillatoria acuminata PCC 6304 TaxID=56110 RepID=K9TDD8_9CYAN|nr:hypothetical protein [Oscillatoria acuminata]AFY80146.1 hypothetical protein Oscil6304_0396 [Oscillatoria acuminata PCC 6304]
MANPKTSDALNQNDYYSALTRSEFFPKPAKVSVCESTYSIHSLQITHYQRVIR